METVSTLADYHRFTGSMASLSMGARARRGELMFCPPVGYLPHFDGVALQALPDPILAPLVTEAFLLMATGDHSVRKLLTVMSAKGLVSRSGKPMGASALHVMLTNPFYCGKVRWGGELLDGRHESLASKETFEKVQEMLRCGRRRS